MSEAETELANQMDKLNEKRAQLQQVTDKLQALNDEFAAMTKKKKDLEDNIELCSQKLDRAEKLIQGLGGERARWGDMAQMLKGESRTDCLYNTLHYCCRPPCKHHRRRSACIRRGGLSWGF